MKMDFDLTFVLVTALLFQCLRNVKAEDINECDQDNKCHPNAVCVNTIGSYDCSCKDGYTGNGRSCSDINECVISLDDCHEQASCRNTRGSYICLCNDGWNGDGKTCLDINECDQDNKCHPNAVCVNTIGSYDCSCKDGYTGNGRSCSDINECVISLDDCHEQASCSNTRGSYICSCNDGWNGDGKTCLDINECNQDNKCHPNAFCVNTIGSYDCSCKDGYTGNGRSCSEINECKLSVDNCHEQASCRNTRGSYICSCNDGWTGDGRTCLDINECDQDNKCDPNAVCVKTLGSYDCSCNDGYTGNGRSCSVLTLNCTLGMKSRDIQDSQITTSSEYNEDYGGESGRLDELPNSKMGGAWCSSSYDVNQWIQVDLLSLKPIVGFITQGFPLSRRWVKSYKIGCGNSVGDLRTVTQDGIDKIFTANIDGHSKVYNWLPTTMTCRYIRLYPQSWNTGYVICMRMEIIGECQ